MPTQTIKWLKSSAPNIVAYEVLKSDTGISGTYTLLVQVLNRIPGPNWYEDTGGGNSYLFYTDTYIPYRYYRLRVVDQFGNTAEDTIPTPFQAGNDPVAAPSLYFVSLNENTGGTNNLKYMTEGGSPVEGATIRNSWRNLYNRV